jgi:hypothetical protein
VNGGGRNAGGGRTEISAASAALAAVSAANMVLVNKFRILARPGLRDAIRLRFSHVPFPLFDIP